MIVAFDCLRNPPEEWSRVARNSFSRRASTSAPASSLWTIATTSFIARSIDGATDPGQRFVDGRRAGRLVYDARPRACQGRACRSRACPPTTSRDPRASLARAMTRSSPTAPTSRQSSAANCRRRRMPRRDHGRDLRLGSRPATLQLVAAHGMTRGRPESAGAATATDPRQPVRGGGDRPDGEVRSRGEDARRSATSSARTFRRDGHDRRGREVGRRRSGWRGRRGGPG